MMGTLLNIGAVLIGSTLGTLLGGRLPERIRQSVIAGLGLFTLALGFQMFLSTKNALVVLASLLIGVLIGEALKIEDGLQMIGCQIENRLTNGNANQNSRFVRGFLTASLIFCVGPMAILGSIKDGLMGDHSILVVKSILDGFGSLALSSSLGLGVIFSAAILFVYQGGISLLAAQAQTIATSEMIGEMNGVGGVLLIAMAMSNILEIKKIRVGNFLPALFVAPLIVFILSAFGGK